VLAALAAFAVAFRRDVADNDQWQDNVQRRAKKADRSKVTIQVGAPGEGATDGDAEVADVEPVPDRAESAEVQDSEPAAVIMEEVAELEPITPEELGVTRRKFFNRALLGTFGIWSGLMGIAMLGFTWPRLRGGFGADIDAGNAEDIFAQLFQPDGTVVPLFIPEARAYIVPFADSAVEGSQFSGLNVVADGMGALFQRCVHLGCRVPWCSPSQGFECPCHGSKYNRVGEYQAGPAPRNLDRFGVEVDSTGRFIIKTGTIIQTARAPVSTAAYPQGPSCIALAPAEEA